MAGPMVGTSPYATFEARAAVYLLFARLFREPPSQTLLQAIVRERLLTLAELCGKSTNRIEPSLDPAEDCGWLDRVQAIAVEYTRLFAAPGAHAVQPYESVYCDTVSVDTSTACSAYFTTPAGPCQLTGLLHGPSAVAVREAYRRGGFELDPSSHELPDHLGIQLEFMGQLLKRGAGEQAAVFFQAHLGRWVFRCLEDIRQSPPAAFYHAVVDSATTFLQHEQQVLCSVGATTRQATCSE